MSKFELGRFDRTVYDHGQTVVQEMRNVTGIKGGEAHFVTAAVYVDGYLQFAGANVAVGIHIDRLAAKHQAMLIIGRMEPNGEIDKRPAASAPLDDSRIERIVRDAIIDYQGMYSSAPNDDAERELKERAAIANEWLVSHGFEPEKTFWGKEESPCL